MLLLLLAVKELQRLLNLFKMLSKARRAWQPSSLVATQVVQNTIKDTLGPGFTCLDIRELKQLSSSEHPDPYYLVIREDIAKMVQTTLLRCPYSSIEGAKKTFSQFAEPILENGERVYNELWTGNKWIRAEVLLLEVLSYCT
jgi:hypothetical protein